MALCQITLTTCFYIILLLQSLAKYGNILSLLITALPDFSQLLLDFFNV